MIPARSLRLSAFWLLPPAVCFALYWQGLTGWFFQDDFAWLKLKFHLHSASDLLPLMFQPMAQGTIRPLSERAFFIGFLTLFGLDPLPFRVCVFVTQLINLALIALIVRRLTGSALAGVSATILWLANPALVSVMTWTSSYNQALCGFFLLSAFGSFLRYIDTGRRRWLVLQWVMFLLGFGALEINVVYPAIACVYAWLFVRSHFFKTLPLWIPSIAFATVHRLVAPEVPVAPYGMYFDASLVATSWRYIYWALGPPAFSSANWLEPVVLLALWAGFAVFLWSRLRRRDWLPLFFLWWFVVTLAPVLPLRDHLSRYYLTLPTIGLAMLGGWAVASAGSGRWPARFAAVLLPAAYLTGVIPDVRESVSWRHHISLRIEQMVAGVAAARKIHPGKTILLNGVDNELFWHAIIDRPFRLLGLENIYLVPEAATQITQHADLGSLAEFVVPAEPALRGIDRGDTVVYSIEGHRLKNITPLYRATASLRLKLDPPRTVDAGNPLMSYLLDKQWHSTERGYIWIPKRATLRMGGPRAPAERLYISGWCSSEALKQGPLGFRVEVDRKPLKPAAIPPGVNMFHLDFDLPPEALGKPEIHVAVEVDRTFGRARNGREMGVAFGVFEIR